MNYENKYRQKYTNGRYSNIYYIPSAYLNLTPASLLGHSSSCIESQQNAIKRVSLWSTHNTQELVTNNLITILKNYFFWPAFHTSITCMTFIHELDILVFSLFAFILLTVLLLIILLLSEEAPNFKSGVSPGLSKAWKSY